MGEVVKLKREARTLKAKAIASLKRGLEAFNNHDDDGRPETVLLMLQHASEMLTKALLVQKGQSVFDKEKGTSIGIEKALNIAQSKAWMSATQAGQGKRMNTFCPSEHPAGSHRVDLRLFCESGML